MSEPIDDPDAPLVLGGRMREVPIHHCDECGRQFTHEPEIDELWNRKFCNSTCRSQHKDHYT